jgi:two-component system NarL family sensor kinase
VVSVTLVVLVVVLEVAIRRAPGRGLAGGGTFFIVPLLVAVLAFAAVGAVLASRRPANPIGWVFCAASLGWAGTQFAGQYGVYAVFSRPGALPAGRWLVWVQEWLFAPSLGLVAVFTLLLFPDGHLPSRRWRPAGWLAGVLLVAGAAAAAVHPGPMTAPFGRLANPAGLAGLGPVPGVLTGVAFSGTLLLALGAAGSLLVRLRRAAGAERAQLRLVVLAVGLLLGVVAVVVVAAAVLPGSGRPAAWVGEWMVAAAVAAVPVAVAVAVLRHHLLDIDVVVNRALVYGALTVCLAAVYGAVVAGLGGLVRGASLVAAGLVAAGAHPLYRRLQAGVDRLLYGDRADPYALSRLGRRLEASLAPETVLPAVVETVGQALRVPAVTIELDRDGRLEVAARYGSAAGRPAELPVVHRGQQVGRLLVWPRTPAKGLTGADLRLLGDLARQAGAAADAVRLTGALQRSQERLVGAREEERRRLRRDLHDGLGPLLGGVSLGLAGARHRLRRDPAAAEQMLRRLEDQLQAASGEIRRLVDGLRPPSLDELGLVPALRERAARFQHGTAGLSVTVEGPDALPALPAATEVAAYRIALEALTNAARHAHARRCVLRLAVDRALELQVCDDGRGIPAAHHAGVGLASMRQRAREVGGTCTVDPEPGGGTRVTARLPLQLS